MPNGIHATADWMEPSRPDHFLNRPRRVKPLKLPKRNHPMLFLCKSRQPLVTSSFTTHIRG
jgi:hypothetical protein